MHHRSISLAAGALAIALGVTACGSGDGQSAPSPTSAPTTTALDLSSLSPDQLAELSAEWERDPRILAERAAKPDDEAFAFGQELVITDAGPKPATLVAIVDTEVVVRNDTAATTHLVFDNGAVGADELTSTPPIAPGAAFRFTPVRAVSITYHVGDDPGATGHVQVDTGDW